MPTFIFQHNTVFSAQLLYMYICFYFSVFVNTFWSINLQCPMGIIKLNLPTSILHLFWLITSICRKPCSWYYFSGYAQLNVVWVITILFISQFWFIYTRKQMWNDWETCWYMQIKGKCRRGVIFHAVLGGIITSSRQ